MLLLVVAVHAWDLIWAFPKIMVPPNHPFVHRGFHEINHPFWGLYPYFWKHPYRQKTAFVVHIRIYDAQNDDCAAGRFPDINL